MANAKGTLLVGIVKGLRANREAALELLPQQLRPYLNQQILPATWYPEEDFHQLLQALVQAISKMAKDPWAFVGETAANDHFTNVYGGLVRQGDPSATAKRTEAVWRLNHDNGALKCFLNGEGTATLEISDYDYGSEGYARANAAYFRRMIEFSGATEVVARPAGDGDSDWPHRLELSWKVETP